MVKKFKKYTLMVLTMFTFLLFNSSGALAADDSVISLGTRTINETNKMWKITFNGDVDFNSIKGNIKIKDVTTGKDISITPVQDENKSIVKVNAPSEGYSVGHNYQIVVNKNIRLSNGSFLPKTTVLNFIIVSKGNVSYTVSASVLVSPVISAFKQINIISANLPGAAKYKIEGNSKLFDIGKPMVSLVGGNTVKVYICDSTGNVLGTTNMDVSTNKSNMSLNLQ